MKTRTLKYTFVGHLSFIAYIRNEPHIKMTGLVLQKKGANRYLSAIQKITISDGRMQNFIFLLQSIKERNKFVYKSRGIFGSEWFLEFSSDRIRSAKIQELYDYYPYV